ncbi:hypothetical protein ABZ615_14630 [Streptomyces sp. NPDC007325]|uniref:hypothetical protein n=1 Tax=Streptomyces sp. NPDC007325 TaxID=3154588 RepID=UPI0033C9646B
MKLTKKRGIVALVVLVLVAAWAGISYATNTPPFKKPKGTIEAGELCPSFGGSREAADILNRILPYATSYRIPPEEGERRTPDPRDTSHNSWCYVHGDGRLLTVHTEMRGGETEKEWQDRVRNIVRSGGSEPFDAGRWAFTTSTRKAAAVYSACIPYDNAGLSTYIRLRDPAPADRLDDLRRLAAIAAEQAHESAGCTVPADTPLNG